MSAADILADTGHEEGKYIPHEINWEDVSNSLKYELTQPKPVVKPTVERIIEVVTERINKSGSIPESFPASQNQIPFQIGQDYLTASLAETKQRISLFNSVCEGMA